MSIVSAEEATGVEVLTATLLCVVAVTAGAADVVLLVSVAALVVTVELLD